MTFKPFIIAGTVLLFSCNSGSSGKEAERKALDEESKKCVRAMSGFEEKQNEAYRAGDAALAARYKNSFDSAAKANIMIGQKMMALDAEK